MDNVYAEWIDFTADLLQEPLVAFPHERIAMQLNRSFATHAVSWEWRDGAFRQGGQVFAVRGTTMTPEWMRDLHNPELMPRHPLQRWFVTTANPRPQTVGRVPRTVSPDCDVALMNEILSPHQVQQQLAIPYQLTPVSFGLFVMGRPDEDFTEDDVRLASRLQPLLVGLSRQTSAVARHALPDPCQVELTGTELAVLVLLSEGHTAHGIAHTLGNSPRTVGKHLEHIYRKLGVSDRLLATRVARDLGLLPRTEFSERRDS